MEKKSLMPSSLAILSILLYLQLCCCVCPWTDGLDTEAPSSQNCNCIVLQEEVKKFEVKLGECKAEIQLLKDNFKKLRGKPLSLESRQYADSSSCNETAMDGRPLVDGASLKSQSTFVEAPVQFVGILSTPL
ncbi:uncharacterized protein [Acropora muricata]|uniref:uncharacterized protein isoform X2 n=1 Tax=Acropora muricata TaxID=159855 RepID=UPI0034E394CC